ncbi:MAG: phage terminase large subunit family protein [Pseudomonadota bacterium]
MTEPVEKRWQSSRAAYRSRLRDLDRKLAPPPDLTVSEWADAYRKLSSESSAEPGQWSTDRAPFQRGIMDALSDPAVNAVVCKKSAQVGWTEILLNVIGYFAHQDASPILCVQPTLEMGQAFSKDRVAPMVRDSEVLTGLFGAVGSKSGENTLLHKKFPGGHLTIAGANSAAGLASRPIRVALFDEVDRYPPSAGTEGDPVALGIKRTRTFWNRKILMGSTPTLDGVSRIDREYQRSDQRKCFVPCPHCGEHSVLVFEDFDYTEAGTLDDPAWICKHCGGLAFEKDKAAMLRGHEWRATAEFDGIAGFAISEFYSPWSTWSEIFKTYERVKDNHEELVTFTNTTLGETASGEIEEIEPEGLASRAEIYEALVPLGVVLLTAGIDVQQDRFEISVWGWAENGESWLIEHHQITADPSVEAEWTRLDQWLMTRKYEHASGSTLEIVAAAIDSGYLADDVYRYTAKRFGRRFYAVKGYDGESRPTATEAKPRTKGPKPPKMFALGVDSIKAGFFSALGQEVPGPNAVHFPTGLPAEYFEQLTAEQRQIRYVRGFKRYVWKKVRARNEALDCRVYAYAALQILNPVWAALTKHAEDEPDPVPEPPLDVNSKQSVDVLQKQINRIQRGKRRSRFGARR